MRPAGIQLPAIRSHSHEPDAPATVGAPTPQLTRGNARWRVLILRIFDLAVKGGPEMSPADRSVGSRHRRGLARQPHGARRGSHDPATPTCARRWSLDPATPTCARRGSLDPAGLLDRQVSRAHPRPRFQRCSCLLSLLQTKETYRSSIWAGSGDPRPAHARPAPSACETCAQRVPVIG
jgi:hypothetical protein